MTKFPTGLPTLDKYLDGLHPGDLGIILGYRGLGKTAFCRTVRKANTHFSLPITFTHIPHHDLIIESNWLTTFDYIAVGKESCWFAPEYNAQIDLRKNLSILKKDAVERNQAIIISIALNRSGTVKSDEVVVIESENPYEIADFTLLAESYSALTILKNRRGPKMISFAVEYVSNGNHAIMKEVNRG